MPRIQDMLRHSAERESEALAFVGKDRTTTYAELERDSSRFAAALVEAGIKRGERVALVLDGDVDFLVAYYGIAKAGAVVVPVCPDTRTGPLVYTLAHSGAAVCILDAVNAKYIVGQSANLPDLRLVVCRGELGTCDGFESRSFRELLACSVERVADEVQGDDLLSIAYTSGTTGRPKGVMLSHRNLVANTRSIVEYLQLGRHDRIAMILPFYYAYGNSILHTHICAGGTIVRAGGMTFPVEVLRTIQDQKCTGFSGVPATFARILALDSLKDYDLSGLRYITQAGAAMNPLLTGKLRVAFPDARIFVMYGQTEASARLAYVPPEELERKMGSAGKAIPGVALSVVDEAGNRLPVGSVGEIVARGDNVMLGYWQDHAETERVLRADGLHTGDSGYMDEDGFIYIVGRESEIIKSGAHRISPYEIEDAVCRAPGVREAAVVGLPDELMGHVIAAFVVTEPGQAIDRQALLRSCLGDLPRFKLPERIFMIDELPRTASGKVRRKELVELFQSGRLRPV